MLLPSRAHTTTATAAAAAVAAAAAAAGAALAQHCIFHSGRGVVRCTAPALCALLLYNIEALRAH